MYFNVLGGPMTIILYAETKTEYLDFITDPNYNKWKQKVKIIYKPKKGRPKIWRCKINDKSRKESVKRTR